MRVVTSIHGAIAPAGQTLRTLCPGLHGTSSFAVRSLRSRWRCNCIATRILHCLLSSLHDATVALPHVMLGRSARPSCAGAAHRLGGWERNYLGALHDNGSAAREQVDVSYPAKSVDNEIDASGYALCNCARRFNRSYKKERAKSPAWFDYAKLRKYANGLH